MSNGKRKRDGSLCDANLTCIVRFASCLYEFQRVAVIESELNNKAEMTYVLQCNEGECDDMGRSGE